MSDIPHPSSTPPPQASQATTEPLADRRAVETGALDSVEFVSELSTALQASQQVPLPRWPERLGRYRVDRQIGRGGFGVVLRAWDPSLQRDVAIKVARPERLGRTGAAAYLHEARLQAKLDHPNIVRVYDCGELPGGGIFVVSKFCSGGTLADQLRRSGSRDPLAAAEWICQVARALHHAHEAGIIHRDIKPANILIDETQAPVISDFGLAIHDLDLGTGSPWAGSPAYMSPEQARGESHRVNRRSDIYSLGVVFYELLCGKRPFSATSISQLLDQIRSQPVPPIRSVAAAVPAELERICMRALQQRPSDRFATAAELADELTAAVVGIQAGEAVARRASPLIQDGNSASESTITPRGLRAFERADAGFFLDLLPGVKDREGLPESVRFWKQRIEPGAPLEPFRVGMLLGPSGIGKSSFVRAGLLPHLSTAVVAMVINARASRLEHRMLDELRSMASIEASTLTAALAQIRRGEGLPPENKLLLVIDQFEQFLHRGEDLRWSDLLEALRQCDGRRVQAMLLVRDDFVTAATQFMELLDEPLSQESNLAVLDLFSREHARNVLIAYGRAFGTLPMEALGREQIRFVEAAIDGLVEDHKVIPVRLTLLAEMLKDQRWVPATLNHYGGMGGLAEAFLAERLEGATAHPLAKAHPTAARRLLSLLLPEDESLIRRRAISKSELIDGVVDLVSPAVAQQMLDAFDVDLKLVTTGTARLDRSTESGTLQSGSVDPQSSPAEDSASDDDRQLHYQLSHDYLVSPLNRWLHRNEMQSASGRARFRLRELARLYRGSPESRFLPRTLETIWLGALTRVTQWDPIEAEVMRRARGRASRRLLGVTAAALLVAGGLWWFDRRQSAAQLVQQMSVTSIADASEAIRAAWTRPDVLQRLAQDPASLPSSLHRALALLGSQPEAADAAVRLVAPDRPEDIPTIARLLGNHRERALQGLRRALSPPADDEGGRELSLSPASRLTYLAMIAQLDPQWAEWDQHQQEVIAAIIAAPSSQRGAWIAALHPLEPQLAKAFLERLEDPSAPSLGSARAGWIGAAALLCKASPAHWVRLAAVCSGEELRSEILPLSSTAPSDLGPLAVAAFRQLDENRQRSAAPPTGIERAVWESLRDQFGTHHGVLSADGGMLVAQPYEEFATMAATLRTIGFQPTAIRLSTPPGQPAPLSAPPEQYGSAPDARPEVTSAWVPGTATWRLSSQEDAESVVRDFESLQDEGWRIADLDPWPTAPDRRWSVLWIADPQSPRQRWVEYADEYTAGAATAAPSSPTHALRVAATQGDGPPRQVRLVTLQDDGGVTHVGCPTEMGNRRPGLVATDLRLRGFEEPGTDTEFLINRLLLAQRDAIPASEAAACEELEERALAFWRAGLYEAALGVLDDAEHRSALSTRSAATSLRIKALAGLGRDEEARVLFESAPTNPSDDHEAGSPIRSSDRVRMATPDQLRELGRSLAEDLRGLEAAQIDKWTLEKVRAAGLAAVRLQELDPVLAERLIDASVQALEVISRPPGFRQQTQFWIEPDLQLIRLSPRFRALAERIGADIRLTTTAAIVPHIEDQTVGPLAVEAHAKQAARLLAIGYYPVAIDLCMAADGATPIAASVWHRSHNRLERDVLQRRRAILAVLAAHHGEFGPLVEALSSAGTLQSEAIEAVALSCLPATSLLERLSGTDQEGLRYALLLALGSMPAEDLGGGGEQRLLDEARRLAATADAGVASAARWYLARRRPDLLNQIALPSARQPEHRALGDGTVLVRLAPVGPQLVGTPADEAGLAESELRHWVVGLRPFEIAATEVTVAQFGQFLSDALPAGGAQAGHDFSYNRQRAPSNDCPQISVRLWDAMRYCQWKSEQENVPADQWCYPDIWTADPATYRLPDDFLSRQGFRLPIEEEWEYAARGGVDLTRPFGQTTRLMPRYAHVASRAEHYHTIPVGTLMPNPFGLHDTLGNASEWCQDAFEVWRIPGSGFARNVSRLVEDDLVPLQSRPATRDRPVPELQRHIVRGGSFTDAADFVRCADRQTASPEEKLHSLGFRIVRTVGE